jgi:hypothetical protein
VPPHADIELVIRGRGFRAIITIPAGTVSQYIGLTYSATNPNSFALVGWDGKEHPISELEGLITVRIEPEAGLQSLNASASHPPKLYAQSNGRWVPVEELCVRFACSQETGSNFMQMKVEYLGNFLITADRPNSIYLPIAVR